jgi:protocatechuate 3,4-dioxygenase beta subunit
LTFLVIQAGVAAAQDATRDAATLTGLRADPRLTEGKPGVPLALQIAVQDITNCTPLANAAVEIWHCDAQGYYSGISGENPGGGGETTGDDNLTTSFLRGVQLTDLQSRSEDDQSSSCVMCQEIRCGISTLSTDTHPRPERLPGPA